MTIDSRNDLIDAYFRALDEADPSVVRSMLADGFVYDSLSGDLDGFEGFSDYITEYRAITDSTHELARRIHADDASVVEGLVTGIDPNGEPAEADFCDVFEFDVQEETITRIAVYANDA